MNRLLMGVPVPFFVTHVHLVEATTREATWPSGGPRANCVSPSYHGLLVHRPELREIDRLTVPTGAHGGKR